MADVTTVTTVLASLKTASEIANLLRSSDLSLEKAEMKLRLADLVGTLADARMQVADLQEAMSAQETRIAALQEAFRINGDMVKKLDAYYLRDGVAEVDGPFCLRCWEVDQQARHLTSAGVGYFMVCPACEAKYDRRRIPTTKSPA